MPSGPPAEFGEITLIASIMIESERVIFVRNKSSSRVVVACERKTITGSLITEVGYGLMNTCKISFPINNTSHICCQLMCCFWVEQWTNLLFTNAVSFSIHIEVFMVNLDL